MSRQLFSIPILEKEVAIYLAGLIDGEGCFIITKSTRADGRVTYHPEIKLVLTDELTIKWVANKLERGYTTVSGNPNKNHKDTSVIRISDRAGIVNFIEQILPYMITKQEVADQLLRFAKSRLINWKLNNSRKLASTYTQIELDYFKRIKELNRVGIVKGGYLNF